MKIQFFALLQFGIGHCKHLARFQSSHFGLEAAGVAYVLEQDDELSVLEGSKQASDFHLTIGGWRTEALNKAPPLPPRSTVRELGNFGIVGSSSICPDAVCFFIPINRICLCSLSIEICSSR